MSQNNPREPMLDMYILETKQLLERLEEIALISEEEQTLDSCLDEIFRIMRTIKENSAILLFSNIEVVACEVEDLFSFFRQTKPKRNNYSKAADIVLESIEFIRFEIEKNENGYEVDGNVKELLYDIKDCLNQLCTEKYKSDDSSYSEKVDEKMKYYVSVDEKSTNKY